MKKYERWWLQDDSGEDSMESEHTFHWEKVLSYCNPEDFIDKIVLDFGCNQGGLLRYVYHTFGFKKGVGIDLGRGSIKIAKDRGEGYPITYLATGDPGEAGILFDTAISSSVIYLIKDLRAHARLMDACLIPGGTYYISYSDYVGNPNLPQIFKTINTFGNIKMNLHSLKDIARAFWEENFQVSVLRLQPQGFIPLSEQDPWHARIEERMDYEYTQSYLFKCTKPKKEN
ncbi:MAG: class I SAM-dependent methyltransferase [Eubacteriaceae bacterium]|nr:class I SAM-dependent methyltransferase [Eubacteriaceae bacterium]